MSRSDEEILYIILEEVDLRLDFRIGWPKKALAGPSALPHIFILYINPCNVTIHFSSSIATIYLTGIYTQET